MEGFPAERAKKSWAPIELAQPFPAPELRAENFTDMRPFLTYSGFTKVLLLRSPAVELLSVNGFRLFRGFLPQNQSTERGSFDQGVVFNLGARQRGRTATQHSKKGSEKVLGRVLQKGSEKGACYGFYSTKRCSEKGSQKGF